MFYESVFMDFLTLRVSANLMHKTEVIGKDFERKQILVINKPQINARIWKWNEIESNLN